MTHPEDALPLAVLQYLAIRPDNPLGAARLRDRHFRELAEAQLAKSAAAREKAREHLTAWTPHGAIPLRPRHDNDETMIGERK